MYDLKEVIEANTVDGVVDYEKVMANVDNTYVNPIVAKKTDKDKIKPEVIAEVVKELGIEGASIEDVKLYIKKMGGSTDEIKEASILLEAKYKELETKYNGEVETRTALETKQDELHKEELIKSLGITDDKQIEFMKWSLSKKVTEDINFDTVVAEYAKENNVKTTTKFVKNPFGGNTNETDISVAWRKKRELRRK